MKRIRPLLSRVARPRLLLAFAAAVLLCAGGVYASLRGTEGPREYTIEAKEGSFFPSKIALIVGDKVTFKNLESHSIWPASDPHPTHEFLAAFDPGAPIPPGGSWTYKFSETGTWRFHDHLDVTVQGEIHALGRTSEKTVKKSASGGYCDGKCFDDLVKETVKEKGIDAAYALFQETYDSGNLPRSCHWTAHKIGEEAYHLFKEGKDFAITQATSYCAYGFYHGFLEGLLRDNPDPAYALTFCDKVEEKLGRLGLQNCYHGIGHGFTEDPPDPKVEGDFEGMIEPGIKMCEFLFGKDFNNLNLCLTGVYTVPAGFASDGTYGLSIDPKDPFALCKDEPLRYKKACYGEFAPKLDKILEGDMSPLPSYVSSIDDDRLKRLVVWVVPSVMMSRDVTSADHSKYVDSCRQGFEGRYRLICWGGSILGFFSHGKPEKEYEPALAFCASASWKTEGERTFCYGEAFRQMRQNYSIEKVKSICPLAPKAYERLCLDEKGEHTSPYDDPSF
ncbi:MAG: hypothetical protein HZA81_03500 [Candidatus Taylorbacteria bacterium]|nr:hypothetical protein [Candidatus Taylorbacteria bacterium]